MSGVCSTSNVTNQNWSAGMVVMPVLIGATVCAAKVGYRIINNKGAEAQAIFEGCYHCMKGIRPVIVGGLVGGISGESVVKSALLGASISLGTHLVMSGDLVVPHFDKNPRMLPQKVLKYSLSK